MVDQSMIYFVCSHADCEAPMQLFEDVSGALKDSEPTIDRINQAFKVFKKAHGHVKKAEPALSPLQAALLSCIARVDRKDLADSTYIALRAAEDYRREVLNLTNWHLPVASQGARYVWTINGIRNLKIMAKRGLVEQHNQQDLYAYWVITEAGRKVLSEC